MERLVPFGKYFLLERINVGGMAEVFKAKTVGVEGFEKIVAIKRILPAVAEDEDFIKMFVDEAKITSQLSHANLAQTFDLGCINDSYYIAMEYVQGKDLRAIFERLKRRGERMPAHVAAYVVARLCDGLDYAHRKRGADGRSLGIIHRDVSPQNIILSYEGEVKLVDFGIAKAANKITKTQAGILKGKFGYMSPEQVRGLPLDGRSDIFAAGVVLYELITGERLFTGSSDFSVLEKVQAAKIVPPSQVQKDVPLALERVVLKALAREAEERYQHAADLGSDLTRFLIDWRGKTTTREDVAAFMKSAFPPDEAAEARERRRAPTIPPPIARRSEPPSVIASDVEEPAPPSKPPDETTRPMSMDDLAAAERAYVAARSDKPRASRPPPRLPASLLADGPAVGTGADAERTTPAGVPAPPAGAADATDPNVALPRKSNGSGGHRPLAGPHWPSAPPPPAPPPADRAPYDGRIATKKPTLLADDATSDVEITDANLSMRARWLRRALYGMIAVALLVTAWGLYAAAQRSKKPAQVAVPAGSLTVNTEPEDAVVLLDGAQVKDPLARSFTEPRLSAKVEHRLLVRREGFEESAQVVVVQAGEQRTLEVKLAPLPGQLTIRSEPAGAQVFVDGTRRGVTPLYLADVDQSAAHAIVLEKRCYHTWQLAIPAHAGKREVAAALQALPGACAGRSAREEQAAAPAVPDDPTALASMGFLTLSARPATAHVFIDGVDIGRMTPLTAWPLKVGTHKVRVAAGKKGREVTIEIRSGQTHSEIVDLRKR